jgi:glyoxylase-like metal-dependent hydrolase (beta-lactamase superfamily II)
MTTPITSNTLGVNVFTAPGKPMAGERPKPFGEALGFDPMTSTLIFGEYDAVLVDAMTTVAEAEALADWVALHNRNLETIYLTHAHFDHFYGLSILLDRFPGARAIATPKTVNAMQMSFTPPVERLARRLFPGQVATQLVAPQPYEHDTFTLEGKELRIIEQGHTDSPDRRLYTFHRWTWSSQATWCTTSATCTSATPPPRAGRTGSRRWTGWQR